MQIDHCDLLANAVWLGQQRDCHASPRSGFRERRRWIRPNLQQDSAASPSYADTNLHWSATEQR